MYEERRLPVPGGKKKEEGLIRNRDASKRERHRGKHHEGKGKLLITSTSRKSRLLLRVRGKKSPVSFQKTWKGADLGGASRGPRL